MRTWRLEFPWGCGSFRQEPDIAGSGNGYRLPPIGNRTAGDPSHRPEGSARRLKDCRAFRVKVEVR